jgi:hypothetical protein
MAQNSAYSYGTDIACLSDADDMFSEATGISVVVQDAVHAITVDDFLGPGGNGRGWDCRKLLGMKINELTAYQPIVAEVLTRDDRILTADVQLTATTTRGLADVLMAIRCETALGPFELIKSVLDLTESDIDRQAT